MVKVILCDPFNEHNELDFNIELYDKQISKDWVEALKLEINGSIHDEFCFLGFPDTYRNVDYLCNKVNTAISELNSWFEKMKFTKLIMPEVYSKETITRESLNQLHNYFEVLKGTIWQPSAFFRCASTRNKHNIELLNWTCHELERLDYADQLSIDYGTLRPSNCIMYRNSRKYHLTDEHREGYAINRYDEKFGEVSLGWCQIGKTLQEVYNDEGPIDLVYTDASDIRTKQSVGGARCEAITALRYYSSDFNISWGEDLTRKNNSDWAEWHTDFFAWLNANGIDHTDPKLSLGHLPMGMVTLQESFGTTLKVEVWDLIGKHLHVKGIEVT